MKIYKTQQGFSVVEIILVIVMIGLLVTVGWLVYDRTKHKPTASSNVPTTNTAKSNTAVTIPAPTYKVPDGYMVYENRDLGFKFAYPKEWGDIKLQSDPSKTDLFLLIFSPLKDGKNNAPSIELRAQSANTKITNSDSPYAKGYIKNGNQYYFRNVGDNIDDIWKIKATDLLGEVSTFSAGTAILVSSGAGPYPYLTGLVNLKSAKFPGVNITFNDAAKAEVNNFTKGYDNNQVEVLKKVLATFFQL